MIEFVHFLLVDVLLELSYFTVESNRLSLLGSLLDIGYELACVLLSPLLITSSNLEMEWKFLAFISFTVKNFLSIIFWEDFLFSDEISTYFASYSTTLSSSIKSSTMLSIDLFEAHMSFFSSGGEDNFSGEITDGDLSAPKSSLRIGLANDLNFLYFF